MIFFFVTRKICFHHQDVCIHHSGAISEIKRSAYFFVQMKDEQKCHGGSELGMEKVLIEY